MKRSSLLGLIAFAALTVFPGLASAQFAITRHIIAGGGGESDGSGFNLRGTIGQNAAGPTTGPMSGSGFTLLGEFWPGQPPPCPSDFNNDGFVTGDDFDQFVIFFVAGTDEADFNGDGFVTGDDFDAFVVKFVAGC